MECKFEKILLSVKRNQRKHLLAAHRIIYDEAGQLEQPETKSVNEQRAENIVAFGHYFSIKLFFYRNGSVFFSVSPLFTEVKNGTN